jgi:DNA anti-recombination protein RmuC
MVAEKEREPEEGEAQKSPTQIVADSLSQISPASTFLPNMGVTPVSKPSRSTSATEARLRSQFEATIEAQREEAARKQEQLEAQIEAQQATIQANQAALEQNQSLLRQTQEDVKGMQTKFEETNALLRAMLNLQNSSCR